MQRCEDVHNYMTRKCVLTRKCVCVCACVNVCAHACVCEFSNTHFFLQFVVSHKKESKKSDFNLTLSIGGNSQNHSISQSQFGPLEIRVDVPKNSCQKIAKNCAMSSRKLSLGDTVDARAPFTVASASPGNETPVSSLQQLKFFKTKFHIFQNKIA